MEYQVIVVLVVLAFLIISLYFELFRPTFSFIVAIIFFLLFGIISPAEALHGFGNEQLAIIVLLLLLGSILQKSGIIDTVFQKLFSIADGPDKFLIKMMTGVGLTSAFFNNTPLVAMFMPYVNSWSLGKNISPSKFLIPLSYASILGGSITLIGTSTNLIVNGLAVDYGEASLGIFDFAYVGIPMMIIGIIYILFTYKKLLPNKEAIIQTTENREYFVEAHIEKGSNLIGKTVREASLRNLKDLFLVEILRDGELISPAGPDNVLKLGDSLFFAGETNIVTELTQSRMGLSLPKSTSIPKESVHNIIEIVISQNSNLIGKSVKECNFRDMYGGSIFAIHRSDEKLSGKIGKMKLQAGDLLMLIGGQDISTRISDNSNFYVLSKNKEIPNIKLWKPLLIFLGIIISILLASVKVVPLIISLSSLVLLSLALNLTRPGQIRNQLDFELIIIIALGLALGKAMINSGTAAWMSGGLVQNLYNFGPIIILGTFFLVTNLLTSFMTSKAAVAIILPIALTVVHNLSLPVAPFVLIVAFGGAASFITPIGYQTNLMVYGPGRYEFKDYMKIGLPLTILYLIVSVAILSFMYDFI